MRTSILLATRGRATRLREAVTAVARLDVPPGWDVELLVISNDSGSDGTADWLSTQAPDLAPGVRLVWLPEPLPGKSRALNRGLRAATGEVLAFIDDDVVLDPSWLRELREAVESGAEAVQGGIRLRLPERPPWWLTPRVEAILAATTLWSHRTPVTELIGSNMAVVRGPGVPEFCEEMGPGVKRFPVGEDADWSMRCLETRRGVFWPAMSASHVLEGRLRVEEVARRQWFGGLNQVIFAPRNQRPAVILRATLSTPREVARALWHLLHRRPALAMDAVWTLCRHAGILSAALGRGRGHPRW